MLRENKIVRPFQGNMHRFRQYSNEARQYTGCTEQKSFDFRIGSDKQQYIDLVNR